MVKSPKLIFRGSRRNEKRQMNEKFIGDYQTIYMVKIDADPIGGS